VSTFNCKAHKEKTYMPFNALYGLKNTQTIKKTSMTYMFIKINHKPYMPFNTLYGFKSHKPLKRYFNDLYVKN
jgi:hypothetical protein